MPKKKGRPGKKKSQGRGKGIGKTIKKKTIVEKRIEEEVVEVKKKNGTSGTGPRLAS
jgi:hypothetical protein